jgi:hypothetical protein
LISLKDQEKIQGVVGYSDMNQGINDISSKKQGIDQ